MSRIKEFRKSQYKDVCDIPPRIIKNITNAIKYFKEKEAIVKIKELPEQLYPSKDRSTSQIKSKVCPVLNLQDSAHNAANSNVASSVSTADTSSTNTKSLCFTSCRDMFELERYPISYPIYPSRPRSSCIKSNSSTASGTSTAPFKSTSESTCQFSSSTIFKNKDSRGRKQEKTPKVKTKCSRDISVLSNDTDLSKKSVKGVCSSRCKSKKSNSSISTSTNSSRKSAKRVCSGRYNSKKSNSSVIRCNETKTNSCLCCKSEKLLGTKSYSAALVSKPKCSNRATSCNFFELELISPESDSIYSIDNVGTSNPMLVEELIFVDVSSHLSEPRISIQEVSNQSSDVEVISCESAKARQLILWSAANWQLLDPKKLKRNNKRATKGTVRIVSRIVDAKPGCRQRVVTRVRIPSMRLK